MTWTADKIYDKHETCGVYLCLVARKTSTDCFTEFDIDVQIESEAFF